MTEVEWLTCGDPVAVLRLLFERYDRQIPADSFPTARKVRLAAIAIARQGGCGSWAGVGHLIHAAERIADGTPHDLSKKDLSMVPPYVAHWLVVERDTFALAERIFEHYKPDTKGRMVQASILRDIVPNPYHVTRRWWGGFAISGERGRFPVEDYLTDEVISLAQAAYEMRRPDGTLDPVRLAILADALEEAGCTDEEVLRHLHGQELCHDCMLPSPETAEYGGSHYWCPRCGGISEAGQDNAGWMRLRSPHYRGCWALDLVLGKE